MSGFGQQFLPGLFPRLLGLVYLIAFLSLLVQLRGLYGSHGMLPIASYLAELKNELGTTVYRFCPTIFWFSASDRTLVSACSLGVVLSLILMAGGPALPLLALLWVLYLSFVSAGQEFLSYQWDTLLLEAGFMTIFLPLASPAPPLVVFTYCFFLFRFMFSSGAVKLLSGDTSWRDLTAMCHHYQTQPIPNRIAWYAHQQPVPVQKFTTFMTLVLELGTPLLALGPQPGRMVCFALMVLLQAGIFATGNFGFFNILTVVLCVPLLDDALFAPYLVFPSDTGPASAVAVSAIFSIFLILNLCQLLALVYRPGWLRKLLSLLSPFMISNHYGLFAVMTTERYEFVIEGSMDRERWQAYEFGWKPGDPKRPPRQAAPHQPRLDWQMWFAALDPGSLEPWLVNLVVRLLQGSPPVLSLLQKNPFPTSPPRFIRLSVYRYQFSRLKTRRSEGVWWERTLAGRFKPMALQEKQRGNKPLRRLEPRSTMFHEEKRATDSI